MTNTAKQERADLAQAERHIIEGERHVAEQEIRIEHLRADGHDAAAFEAMLETFKTTLEAQHRHRELILERIVQLDDAQEFRDQRDSAAQA